MKRYIKSSTDKYVLKDLCANAYYSKETTGHAWSYNEDDADLFESRADVINFGKEYFGNYFLYGRDWTELVKKPDGLYYTY